MAYSGNWDFTTDSDEQIKLSDELNTTADDFDGKVKEMYDEIDEMGNYWVGVDYNDFKTGTNGYSNALKDLGDSFRMYGTQFKNVSEGTEKLAKDVVEIVDNCTTKYSS